jgi:hypothetical protein
MCAQVDPGHTIFAFEKNSVCYNQVKEKAEIMPFSSNLKKSPNPTLNNLANLNRFISISPILLFFLDWKLAAHYLFLARSLLIKKKRI